MTDIAITGLDCRFPGAPDARASWKLLVRAERRFSSALAGRWNHEVFHEPDDRSAAHASYTGQVALLPAVDRFDALHYGVPPARARAMDPRHRLMPGLTREALDDAGPGSRDFDGEHTGVLFGLSVSGYEDLRSQRSAAVQGLTLPGSVCGMASGTVSRCGGLGGPGFAVDAACSGSLVALDRAIAQLERGTCRIAVVRLSLTPGSLVRFSRLRALCAAGLCRPFDEEADGFVLGEDAGTVVLRPLADALAAGDRVYAVIKGTGCAHDGGASPAPLVPTPEGRLRAMRRACEDAGLPPSTAGFPEAHGTATAARLRFAGSARPWTAGNDGHAPPRAAVSSFGSGGTDVHAVPEERPRRTPPVRGGGSAVRAPQLLLLSAGSLPLLDEHIGDVLGTLDALDPADRPPVGALAHTLGARAPLKARLAIVAASTEEFAERLRRARRQLADGDLGDLGGDAFAAGAPLPAAQRRIALLYSGQGGPRPGMTRELYEGYAGFRAAVDTLGAVAGPDTAALLSGNPGDGDAEPGRRLAATEVCRPLPGTVQIAATRLLADCGITPDLALGHGVGEFAAAAAAGALTGEDTVRLLAARDAALRGAVDSGPPGGMLAVQTDEATCRRLAEGIDGVWPACFNEQRQVVVSGTAEGLAALRRVCTRAGVVTAALEASGAFHSPLMAPAEGEVRALLAGLRIADPVRPVISSVDAEPYTDSARLRELWARHASAPVRFDDAVRTAYAQGARVFLQVSGGGTLLTPVRRTLYHHDDVHLLAADGAVCDDGRGFARALARLAVLGAPADPRGLVPAEDRRLLDLPPARLDGPPYWADTEPPAPAPTSPVSPSGGTPTVETPYELLRLIRHQTALLTHLAAALPTPPAAAPRAAPATTRPSGSAGP
ncbi:beta-ketoacyl synthase N-terminal-like domain-containing protein [Streptomyces sp. NPDC001591]|uniref:beta-ketoacyl synthase N-terminal-like domain-containing protein n=1 Tax=Streptomyces sp. NPDC001591 TaxID=3364589 RepID=UPI003692C2F9